MLHPVVLGRGAKLFADGVSTKNLELIGTQKLASGILILEYAPAHV